MPTKVVPPLNTALALLASYLLGAVPFGLVLARAIKGVDLRTVGSGNIGATNAMRVLGKPLGIVAFLLDFAKGAVPAAFFAGFVGAPLASEGTPLLPKVVCGALAVIGHCYPVYLGFKGGKGVATACGAVVAIEWPVFVIAGLVWLALALTLRYVSLASMAMGVTFPLVAWIRRPEAPTFIVGCGALAALILVRHRANVRRLIAGTEPRIGAKKPAAATEGTSHAASEVEHVS
ncbi:MAG: glycerol-3-phosphate 1-O-acyltransferase PlsY [Planctomycetota bacterium]